MQLPTWLNCELALFPMKATAAMMTTAIRATMSAYSTAVAPPSSWARVFSPSHQVVTLVYILTNMCMPPFRELDVWSRAVAGPSNPRMTRRFERPAKAAVIARLAGPAGRIDAVAHVVELRARAL